MKAWTKEEALKTLEELATQTERLRGSRAFSTEHTIWVTKCLEICEEVFGWDSRYYLSFANLDWQMSSGTIIDPLDYGGNYQAAIDAKHQEAYFKQLGIAKGLLLAAVDYLKDRDIKEVRTARESGTTAA